jgi:hypothetical protein
VEDEPPPGQNHKNQQHDAQQGNGIAAAILLFSAAPMIVSLHGDPPFSGFQNSKTQGKIQVCILLPGAIYFSAGFC